MAREPHGGGGTSGAWTPPRDRLHHGAHAPHSPVAVNEPHRPPVARLTLDGFLLTSDKRCPPTTSRTPRSPRSSSPPAPRPSRHVALMIESLIRQNNSAGRPTVLGLPTGSTPVGLYRELIRLHKEAGLDFSRVVTFNLDEYYPDAAGRPAQLPPLDARDVLRPRQHPAAEHPHPRRHHRRRRRRGLLPPLRADDPPRRRHRPAAPRHRPHRPHRLQRAGLDARTAARAWSRSTRSRAATRPATSSARRTCRTRRSRWASARSSKPARSSCMAFGEHKAPIVQQGRRGADHRRRSPPASCSSTPTRRSSSTRPPPAS